ncbi:MAG: hypothetical protein ACXWH1_15150, partial [Thermoanaerobaculia bacterium]
MAQSTTTTTGSFNLTDSSNLFGLGNSISLDSTNASFAATGAVNATTSAVTALRFGAADSATAGVVWVFDFDNGTDAITPATFVIDGFGATSALSLTRGGITDFCDAASGTVTITSLTLDPAATTAQIFASLSGRFQFDCSNVPASLSGSFDYVQTTTTPGGGGGG